MRPWSWGILLVALVHVGFSAPQENSEVKETTSQAQQTSSTAEEPAAMTPESAVDSATAPQPTTEMAASPMPESTSATVTQPVNAPVMIPQPVSEPTAPPQTANTSAAVTQPVNTPVTIPQPVSEPTAPPQPENTLATIMQPVNAPVAIAQPVDKAVTAPQSVPIPTMTPQSVGDWIIRICTRSAGNTPANKTFADRGEKTEGTSAGGSSGYGLPSTLAGTPPIRQDFQKGINGEKNIRLLQAVNQLTQFQRVQESANIQQKVQNVKVLLRSPPRKPPIK